MSTLWTAHVRLAEGRPEEHIACDAAHVNDQGYLALTLNTYVGAIACYPPGLWQSYRLEAAPEPVTEEQLMSGEKSLNDYRRSLGMPGISDPGMHRTCAALHRDAQGNTIPCPDDAQPARQPEVGDRIHMWSVRHGCLAGTVERPMAFGPGLLFKHEREDFPPDPLVADPHDESRRLNGSWHWPCDGDTEQSVAPEPDVPGPITLTINVAGSVLAERDLQHRIASQISRIAAQRGLRF